MKEISTGAESRSSSPHNGGLNTADVYPDQCLSSLSGSLLITLLDCQEWNERNSLLTSTKNSLNIAEATLR
jgi:hypothetical protein